MLYASQRYLGAVPLVRHPVLAGYRLGATGAEGYAQAKVAVAKWDSLVARVNRLANAAKKAAIVAWMGTLAEEPQGVENDPLSRYQTVLNTVKAYEAETDPAKRAALYDGAEENRIEKLEAFNVELLAKVVDAEKLGISPVETPPVVKKEPAFPWVPVGIAAAPAIGVIAFSGSSKA